MIAGGAAYGYWALKSPVPIRAREPEKGSTILRWEPSRSGGVNPHLTDSPDFTGLSALFVLGPFLARPARRRICRMKRAASPAKTGATLFWRSQLALKPAVRAVAFEGIEPIALGAFKPARPVAVSRHRQVAVRTARIRNCLPHGGNLRPESQQVHSKYNCCGRKIDSIDQATELLRRST